MKYLVLVIFAMAILLPTVTPVFAQGSGGYCLRIDEKETCNFDSMDACNAAAQLRGGYCADNFRLYSSGGSKRFCLATRYGTRCDFNNRKRCVNIAGQMGMEGAACVDNYRLTGDERRKLEEQGAADCAESDLACQAGF